MAKFESGVRFILAMPLSAASKCGEGMQAFLGAFIFFQNSFTDIYCVFACFNRQNIIPFAILSNPCKTTFILFHFTSIAATLRGLLRIAIRAKELEILDSIITINSILMVENEQKALSIPKGR